MIMTVNGRDGYEQCPDCHRPVWVSAVLARYNPLQQLYWWASGRCQDCQAKPGTDLMRETTA